MILSRPRGPAAAPLRYPPPPAANARGRPGTRPCPTAGVPGGKIRAALVRREGTIPCSTGWLPAQAAAVWSTSQNSRDEPLPWVMVAETSDRGRTGRAEQRGASPTLGSAARLRRRMVVTLARFG